MNTRAITAIVRKDLKVVSRNKGVMMPILIAPLMLFVILPAIVALLPLMEKLSGFSPSDVQNFIKYMPAQIQQEFAGLGHYQVIAKYFLVYLMAPLFLIVPLMVSSVIAADSFAGEKERKTMEALLYTPATDRELFIGKLLSGWLAALTVALVGFVIYGIIANVVAWPYMHRVFFPNSMWLVMIFWAVPAIPGLGLGVMVLISSRAQGFQDATQLGNLVVLPVVLMIVGQVSGTMSFSITVTLLVGLVVWLLDGLLIWLGNRAFRRGRLLGA